MAAEDSSCSHVLYAACHDASYLAPLAPHSEQRNKVSLVQGAGFKSEFYKYGLNVTQFPTVFRWSGLPSGNNNSPTSLATASMRGAIVASDKPQPSPASSNRSPLFQSNWRNSGVSIPDGPSATRPNTYTPPDNGWGTKKDGNKAQSRVPCKYYAKVSFTRQEI
jgi:hypothetical protein